MAATSTTDLSSQCFDLDSSSLTPYAPCSCAWLHKAVTDLWIRPDVSPPRAPRRPAQSAKTLGNQRTGWNRSTRATPPRRTSASSRWRSGTEAKGDNNPSGQEQQPLEGLANAVDGGSESTPADSTTNSADDAFGFSFASLPREELDDSQQQLDDQWRRDLSAPGGDAENVDTKTTETAQQTPQSTCVPAQAAQQPRRAGVASVPRKPKPAITINTGSGSTGVGAKRPPPTPVSPPTFSWNDILRVQNLIERCLQQYLSKVRMDGRFCVRKGLRSFLLALVVQNDILITLKEQANVDPAFANVVWQKLEEQNPTFFRAYSLQLQLKEQIIAFNYLISQAAAHARGKARVQPPPAHEHLPARESVGELGIDFGGHVIIASAITFAPAVAH
ncbi:hypothetical protein ON010_g7025 [Phytophthora cinnamomi]|nr:hypothetical protein ON010_g7025 [Phytophthora cinnamomi]